MASQNPNPKKSLSRSDPSNPDSPSHLHSNPNLQSPSSNLYPTIDMRDLVENLFPDPEEYNHHTPCPTGGHRGSIDHNPRCRSQSNRQNYSVELACGDLSIFRLHQGDNIVAVLARVADEIQWPLAKDEAAVKLDDSHYFFSLRLPKEHQDWDSSSDEEDKNISENAKAKGDALLSELTVKETSSADLQNEEERLRGGHLIKGILWCGDVTVDRMKWGMSHEERMSFKSKSEISPDTMKRIRRVKKITKRTEKVTKGVLSGVVKVSGIFTSKVANSKVGKKFFGLLPGEIVLASLDGFSKVCDAVEVAGRNVMSTSSTVTTELVNHRYGEQAAEATNESLDAAGHAIGTAWAAFKIRKAHNPKSALKSSSLAKSAVKAAAAEMKAKNSK
ncbi:hypothetical protein GH714_016082 [Hevea brasiliensis]|uniref:Senescence domain-containing protein n=1 Tax=Hevea brasiliensis TaxID=3981 RepID=A0A6A6LXS8_HEVBR|nr:hypothetical protein GH714_016082 [Hevea brasiliensis]